MPDTDLKQEAESRLGAEISSSEWCEAKEQAERKLKDIIKRFGDEGGARREPWYLAQLVAEIVRSSRFSQFTLDLLRLSSYADEQMEIKKDSPCPKTRAAHYAVSPLYHKEF